MDVNTLRTQGLPSDLLYALQLMVDGELGQRQGQGKGSCCW